MQSTAQAKTRIGYAVIMNLQVGVGAVILLMELSKNMQLAFFYSLDFNNDRSTMRLSEKQGAYMTSNKQPEQNSC